MELPLYPKDDKERDQCDSWAISVLDAWAQRNDESQSHAPVFHRYMGVKGMWTIGVTLDGKHIIKRFETAAEARQYAAIELVKRDSSLNER